MSYLSRPQNVSSIFCLPQVRHIAPVWDEDQGTVVVGSIPRNVNLPSFLPFFEQAEFNISTFNRNIREMFSSAFCRTPQSTSSPVVLVGKAGDDFVGIYAANQDALVTLLEENSNTDAPVTNRRRRRRDVSSPSLYDPSKVIRNPTTCIEYNAVIVWEVSKQNYPVYDSDNLFNTNPTFDYGAFDDLKVQLEQASANITIFSFRFTQEGVYVFRSNANPNRRMVSPTGLCDRNCFSYFVTLVRFFVSRYTFSSEVGKMWYYPSIGPRGVSGGVPCFGHESDTSCLIYKINDSSYPLPSSPPAPPPLLRNQVVLGCRQNMGELSGQLQPDSSP